jgi:hypothetical protein
MRPARRFHPTPNLNIIATTTARMCMHCGSAIQLQPVAGLAGAAECKSVVLCEKRIRRRDPAIGKIVPQQRSVTAYR